MAAPSAVATGQNSNGLAEPAVGQGLDTPIAWQEAGRGLVAVASLAPGMAFAWPEEASRLGLPTVGRLPLGAAVAVGRLPLVGQAAAEEEATYDLEGQPSLLARAPGAARAEGRGSCCCLRVRSRAEAACRKPLLPFLLQGHAGEGRRWELPWPRGSLPRPQSSSAFRQHFV